MAPEVESNVRTVEEGEEAHSEGERVGEDATRCPCETNREGARGKKLGMESGEGEHAEVAWVVDGTGESKGGNLGVIDEEGGEANSASVSGTEDDGCREGTGEAKAKASDMDKEGVEGCNVCF